MMYYKPSRYNVLCDIDDTGRYLVFNTFSGAVAWMNTSYYKILTSNELLGERSFDPQLSEKGFLVPSERNEWDIVFQDRQNYLFNDKPERMNFVIAPTMDCNLHCVYCFEDDGRAKGSMTQKVWDDLFRFIQKRIDEFPSVRTIQILWFGGEPGLKVGEIVTFSAQLLPYLKEKSIRYVSRIVSNAVLLTKDKVTTLHEKGNVFEGQFTIDGLRSTYAIKKGCTERVFDLVMENIISASRIIRVYLRINVDKNNMHEIPDLLRFLLEEKELLGRIKIGFARVENWKKDDENPYLSEKGFVQFLQWIDGIILENGWSRSFLQKRPIRMIGPCNLVRKTNFVIGPDGKLFRCEHCINQAEWSIGNLRDGYISNHADSLFLNSLPKEKCKKCNVFPICGGGCLANSIIYGYNVNCKAFIEQAKEQVRFAERAQKEELGNRGTDTKSDHDRSSGVANRSFLSGQDNYD